MAGGVIQNEVQFSPSPGVLYEIINSGKLGGFSDPTLKKAFGAWQAQLVRVQFQERDEVHRARMDLLNFLNTYNNTRRSTFEFMGESLGFTKSKFKGQNQKALQSEAFENKLMDFNIVSHLLNVTYYKALGEQIDEILKLIDANIVKK